jgi:hypothetical protein
MLKKKSTKIHFFCCARYEQPEVPVPTKHRKKTRAELQECYASHHFNYYLISKCLCFAILNTFFSIKTNEKYAYSK